MKNLPIGPGFWKFNSSLLNNETFKINLKDFMINTASKLNFNENLELRNSQVHDF